MLFHKNSAKISKCSFIILAGISKLWDALLIFKLWISSPILAKSTSSKVTFIWPLQLFWIARMLGWSLYFRMALKAGSLTFFVTGSKFEFWLISRFFTIFSKNAFKTSAVSKCVFKISSFLPQINLVFDAWFMQKWRIYYFLKKLIIKHFFLV